MEKYQCRICNNSDNNQTIHIKEMMLGMANEFVYFKCSVCGCLQISEIPHDLAKYYPKNTYYAYHIKKLRNILKSIVIRVYLSSLNPILSWPLVPIWMKNIKNISRKTAILDVGCGIGETLKIMSQSGFRDVTGIDPFIEQDIIYKAGTDEVKILNTDIYSLYDDINSNKKYDLIMLHHSFEHMENPHKTMKYLYRLLADTGSILIRIPLVDSFAYRFYGTCWFQLDAPRHFYLFTIKAFLLLIEQHGFVIDNLEYDSKGEQFFLSEQYLVGKNLHEGIKGVSLPKKFLYARKAQKLNKQNAGDQACFILKKSNKKAVCNENQKLLN